MPGRPQLKVIIVGNRAGTNIGGSLEYACKEIGVPVSVWESRCAAEGSAFLRHLNWRFRGRRPSRLGRFSKGLVEFCRAWRPTHLIATGIAPVNKQALHDLGAMNINRLNYLTDDPFSSAHYAPWFLRSLPEYDTVFSPRLGNMDDLTKLGCNRVAYLPFGYAPELGLHEMPAVALDPYRSDIFFAGGADRDRIAYISALSDVKIDVGLYGDYWDRYAETRSITRGYADLNLLRLAIHAAKVSLCLVRRANRDGHSMRTFELAASGTCMLVEDTDEHRSIFGEDKEAVVYFRSISEMAERAVWLLGNCGERARLGATVKRLILSGRHTYRDRLTSMLGIDGAN